MITHYVRVNVTTISSYSLEAWGLNFGMMIHLINATIFIDQIFKFLFRSWDIQAQSANRFRD